MKRYLLVVMALMLTGCGIPFSPAQITLAQELCRPNGGVYQYVAFGAENLKVICHNGGEFVVRAVPAR